MLALSTWGDVVVGYVVTFGALGLVALRLVQRGKALSRDVADEDKPWI